MVKLSNYFGKNLWCTFTQILNEKISVLNFQGNKKLQVNIQLIKLKRPRKKRYYEKSTSNLIWPKRPFTLEHGAGKINS